MPVLHAEVTVNDYCDQCGKLAYAYELELGICVACEENIGVSKTWVQCFRCKRAVKTSFLSDGTVPAGDICLDCRSKSAAELTKKFWSDQEPTAEDMDYVYTSLGVPNPNK